MGKVPLSSWEIIKRTKNIPKTLKWLRNKHLVVSNPEFWGTHHIFIGDDLTHYIFLLKTDRTTHLFIGNPMEAQKWRKYDGNINLVLSEELKAHSLEWKLYKDYILYKGTMLPSKDIPEEPYFGKIIQVEELPEINITDNWLIEKIKELYNTKK